MRPIAMLAAALLIPVAAQAQDLLADANQDVLNGLVFQGRAEARATVTATLPHDLAQLEVPDGFALIGTAVRGDGSRTTAFRTSHPAARALDMLLAALDAQGWEVEMPQAVAARPTFNAPSQIQARTICRNGERRGVLVRDFEGASLASILRVGFDPSPRACHAAAPGAGIMGPGGFAQLVREMPRFDFPQGVRVLGGGGGGGGNDHQIAGTRVHSAEDNASALALTLSRQLANQGWTRDAAWVGELGSGSNWTRKTDELSLLGALEVIDLGADHYDVSFTLVLGH